MSINVLIAIFNVIWFVSNIVMLMSNMKYDSMLKEDEIEYEERLKAVNEMLEEAKERYEESKMMKESEETDD